MKISYVLVGLCIVTLVTTSVLGNGSNQMKKEDIIRSHVYQINFEPGPGIIAEYSWEYLGSNQVRFTDTSTGGGGPVQLAWDFTNDGTDDAWGSTATYTYPGSGPYYCDHWVRGDDDTQSQVLKPVRWDEGIIAEYTCEYLDNYQVRFTDTSTGGGGPVQLAWDFTNDGTDDAWGSTATYTYPDSGPYCCDHWVRGDDDTQSQVLKPLRPSSGGGSADFIFTVDGLCVTFTDTSTGGGGVKQMAWDFTDDGTDDAWQSPVTHCYPSAGTYTVEHWVKFNDDSQDTISMQVTVIDEGIKADFTWTAIGYTVTFTDTSTGGGGVAQSAWDFTNDGTDDAWGLVVVHTYPERGPFEVDHWVKGNDGSEDTIIISVTKVTTNYYQVIRFWEYLFERFPYAFPLLRHCMEY